MAKVTVKVDQEGNTSFNAVYSDKWRPFLESLGALQVTRASEVEFDSTTGEWVAVLRQTGKEIARGRDRAQVIAEEVQYIERHVL